MVFIQQQIKSWVVGHCIKVIHQKQEVVRYHLQIGCRKTLIHLNKQRSLFGLQIQRLIHPCSLLGCGPRIQATAPHPRTRPDSPLEDQEDTGPDANPWALRGRGIRRLFPWRLAIRGLVVARACLLALASGV